MTQAQGSMPARTLNRCAVGCWSTGVVSAKVTIRTLVCLGSCSCIMGVVKWTPYRPSHTMFAVVGTRGIQQQQGVQWCSVHDHELTASQDDAGEGLNTAISSVHGERRSSSKHGPTFCVQIRPLPVDSTCSR